MLPDKNELNDELIEQVGGGSSDLPELYGPDIAMFLISSLSNINSKPSSYAVKSTRFVGVNF